MARGGERIRSPTGPERRCPAEARAEASLLLRIERPPRQTAPGRPGTESTRGGQEGPGQETRARAPPAPAEASGQVRGPSILRGPRVPSPRSSGLPASPAVQGQSWGPLRPTGRPPPPEPRRAPRVLADSRPACAARRARSPRAAVAGPYRVGGRPCCSGGMSDRLPSAGCGRTAGKAGAHRRRSPPIG